MRADGRTTIWQFDQKLDSPQRRRGLFLFGLQHMATAKPSNEMSFGVGLVFTLLGGGIVGFFVFGQFLPAAWVYFAYRPVQGTVVETRPAEESFKHSKRHHLEALLEYFVDGQD